MKLLLKAGVLTLLSAAVLLTGGCVSSGTYQAKEQESLELSKTLAETRTSRAELEEKNRQLLEAGETVKQQLKKLEAEIADFKSENEKLKLANDSFKAENEKLSLAARPENLLKSLAEALAALQAENSKLKQALASPRSDAEPPVKLTPVVNKPVAPGAASGTNKSEAEVVPGRNALEPAKEVKEPAVDSERTQAPAAGMK